MYREYQPDDFDPWEYCDRLGDLYFDEDDEYMPRSSDDLAYEKGEMSTQVLSGKGTCEVQVYPYLADAGGGRYETTPTLYTSQSCRLEPVSAGNMDDPEMPRELRYYNLQLAYGTTVTDDLFLPNAQTLILVRLTVLDGASVQRFFKVMSVELSSESALRTLRVLEIP